MSKYKFFAYCPNRGFDVFETLDEALDAAEERIHDYHDDDGWGAEFGVCDEPEMWARFHLDE